MKYCTHCGAQIEDDAIICVNCGCATNDGKSKVKDGNSSMGKAALAFMIIASILTPIRGFYNYSTATNEFIGLVCLIFGFVSLAWCIPMTIHFGLKLKKGESVGNGFKVCSLLFVSLIAGILMFCMPKADN